MALTQDELQLMQEYKKAGKTKDDFISALPRYRAFRDGNTQQPKPESSIFTAPLDIAKNIGSGIYGVANDVLRETTNIYDPKAEKGILSRTIDKFQGANESNIQATRDMNAGKQGAFETSFQQVGQAPKLVGGVMSDVLGSAISTVTPDKVKEVGKNLFDYTANTDLGKEVLGAVNTVSQGYENLSDRTKRNLALPLGALELASNVASIPGINKAGKVLGSATEKATVGAKDILSKSVKGLSNKLDDIKVKKMEKGIEEIYQAVNPTTKENKAQLQKRVEDLLPYIDEKNSFNNDLPTVKARVDADMDTAYTNMKNYEDSVGVKGTVETAPIIKKIEDKFIEKTSNGVIINEDQAKIANQLIEKLKQFGDKVTDADIIKIRRSWDDIIEKNKGFLQSAEANAKGDIFGEANKFFREEIRKSNPEYANYLKDFHTTKMLSDILDATILRRTGQTQGGFLRTASENVARTVGAGLGASVGSVPGAIVGAGATELLLQGVKKLTGSSVKLAKGKKLILKARKNGTYNNNIRNRTGTNLVTNKEQLTKGPRLELPSPKPSSPILKKPQTVILKKNSP